MRHALIACLAALLGALSVVGPARSEQAAMPPEVALKRVNLLVRDIERALALTQVTGVELPPHPPLHLSAPVIRVERFDDVHAKLKAAGLDVVEPRRSKTAEGRDFSGLAFTDPDGHLVVLCQLD